MGVLFVKLRRPEGFRRRSIPHNRCDSAGGPLQRANEPSVKMFLALTIKRFPTRRIAIVDVRSFPRSDLTPVEAEVSDAENRGSA